MSNMYARLWRHLDPLFSEEARFEKARLLVPLFYYFVEFMSLGVLLRYPELLERGVHHPYWGVAWIPAAEGLGLDALAVSLLAFFFGISCGALWYRRRVARIIAFLSIFQFQAFMIAVDGQANEYYIPLFVSFFFMFFPSGWDAPGAVPERARRALLQLFWAGQAYILSLYAASGMFKLFSTLQQIGVGEANFFSPDAAALFVIEWLSRFHTTTMLGEYIVAHPYFGWAGLLAVLYVLACSVFVPFVPVLHRAWGFGLVLFHLSTVLSIGLLFWFNAFFVLLFLAASPFAPERTRWRDVAHALPIFGWLWRLLGTIASRAG